MERQLSVSRRGEFYHAHIHNYAGPFEGHKFGEKLELTEVQPPPDGDPVAVLQPGQYVLVHPMDRNPDFHALLPAVKLEALAKLARFFHMQVREGSELLPEVAEVEDALHVEVEDPAATSYVAFHEQQHQSVWKRGPKAVVGALLVRLVPLAVIIFAAVVVMRHVGDHHGTASLNQLFRLQNQPRAEQGFLDRLVNPDYTHLFRYELRGVRFAKQNRVILTDGNFLEIGGMPDLMPMLEMAQELNQPPILEGEVQGDQIVLTKVSCGDRIFARAGTLARLARLSPSSTPPSREFGYSSSGFRQMQNVLFDDKEALDDLVGRRISLTGTMHKEEERYVLRLENGAGVVLRLDQRARAMESLFERICEGRCEPVVDMVLRDVYEWRDRDDPARSRETTRLIGEAVPYSTSVQNYHLVVRR